MQDEIARRVNAMSLEGHHPVCAGTRAYWFVSGHNMGELRAWPPSGHQYHTNIHQAEIFLFQTGNVELNLRFEGLLSADSMQVDVSLSISLQLSEPIMFFHNFMQQAQKFTKSDLSDCLSEKIRSWLEPYIRSNSCRYWQEIKITNVENALNQHLRNTLQNWGLRVVQLSKFSVYSEILAASKDLQYRRARLDLMRQLREVILSDQLDKITNEQQLAQLLADHDRHQLLLNEEKEALLKSFTEQKTDKARARQHLLKLQDQHYQKELNEIALADQYEAQRLQKEHKHLLNTTEVTDLHQLNMLQQKHAEQLSLEEEKAAQNLRQLQLNGWLKEDEVKKIAELRDSEHQLRLQEFQEQIEIRRATHNEKLKDIGRSSKVKDAETGYDIGTIELADQKRRYQLEIEQKIAAIKAEQEDRMSKLERAKAAQEILQAMKRNKQQLLQDDYQHAINMKREESLMLGQEAILQTDLRIKEKQVDSGIRIQETVLNRDYDLLSDREKRQYELELQRLNTQAATEQNRIQAQVGMSMEQILASQINDPAKSADVLMARQQSSVELAVAKAYIDHAQQQAKFTLQNHNDQKLMYERMLASTDAQKIQLENLRQEQREDYRYHGEQLLLNAENAADRQERIQQQATTQQERQLRETTDRLTAMAEGAMDRMENVSTARTENSAKTGYHRRRS
jgi:hypothetical protein